MLHWLFQGTAENQTISRYLYFILGRICW